jgi:hypothetical protein
VISEWAKGRNGDRAMPMPTIGRAKNSSRRVYRPFAPSPFRRLAVSPTRPLHSSGLKQTVMFMEVDFQAIKVEELKSRLGELRRFL